jgi:ferrous iron transport protein A
MQIRSIRVYAMPSRPLSSLLPGDEGVITAVHGAEALGKRLNALGFSIGRRLRLLRQAGLRGPLHVRLGTTDVALRPAEAAGIAIRLAGTRAA